MPMTRSSTTTEYDLATPIVLTAPDVFLSGRNDARSVVVDHVTVVTTWDGGPDTPMVKQILITGYVIDADGQRTAPRVVATPITDRGQRADLLTHIDQEG